MSRTIQQCGFTLIEVIIVIAVVSIITVIAVPSFQAYVIESRRADAKISLLDASHDLEACRVATNPSTYIGCAAVPAVSQSTDRYYTITSVVPTATTYTLTATPTPGQGQTNDTDCTSFTLDDTRAETATGADAANCW